MRALASITTPPDLLCLFLCQLSARIRLSPKRTRTIPPLGDLVVTVVQMRTKKEMGRTKTHAIIAVMKNEQAIRNRAKMNNPRNPMYGIWATSKADYTVPSSLIHAAYPFPTIANYAPVKKQTLSDGSYAFFW